MKRRALIYIIVFLIFTYSVFSYDFNETFGGSETIIYTINNLDVNPFVVDVDNYGFTADNEWTCIGCDSSGAYENDNRCERDAGAIWVYNSVDEYFNVDSAIGISDLNNTYNIINSNISLSGVGYCGGGSSTARPSSLLFFNSTRDCVLEFRLTKDEALYIELDGETKTCLNSLWIQSIVGDNYYNATATSGKTHSWGINGLGISDEDLIDIQYIGIGANPRQCLDTGKFVAKYGTLRVLGMIQTGTPNLDVDFGLVEEPCITDQYENIDINVSINVSNSVGDVYYSTLLYGFFRRVNNFGEQFYYIDDDSCKNALDFFDYGNFISNNTYSSSEVINSGYAWLTAYSGVHYMVTYRDDYTTFYDCVGNLFTREGAEDFFILMDKPYRYKNIITQVFHIPETEVGFNYLVLNNYRVPLLNFTVNVTEGGNYTVDVDGTRKVNKVRVQEGNRLYYDDTVQITIDINNTDGSYNYTIGDEESPNYYSEGGNKNVSNQFIFQYQTLNFDSNSNSWAIRRIFVENEGFEFVPSWDTDRPTNFSYRTTGTYNIDLYVTDELGLNDSEYVKTNLTFSIGYCELETGDVGDYIGVDNEEAIESVSNSLYSITDSLTGLNLTPYDEFNFNFGNIILYGYLFIAFILMCIFFLITRDFGVAGLIFFGIMAFGRIFVRYTQNWLVFIAFGFVLSIVVIIMKVFGGRDTGGVTNE